MENDDLCVKKSVLNTILLTTMLGMTSPKFKILITGTLLKKYKKIGNTLRFMLGASIRFNRTERNARGKATVREDHEQIYKLSWVYKLVPFAT